MAEMAAVIDKVCGELPGGWQMVLEMERDSGFVLLYDPDGEPVEFATNYEGIENAILDALRHALSVDVEGE